MCELPEKHKQEVNTKHKTPICLSKTNVTCYVTEKQWKCIQRVTNKQSTT